MKDKIKKIVAIVISAVISVVASIVACIFEIPIDSDASAHAESATAEDGGSSLTQ